MKPLLLEGDTCVMKVEWTDQNHGAQWWWQRELQEQVASELSLQG